jgi:drug/metabolite transporter (DMT)-like permease
MPDENASASHTPAAPRHGPPAIAWLLFVIPGIFWAGNAVVGRLIATTIPPVGLAFWRWTIAAAVILPFAWPHLRRDWPAMLDKWKPMLAISLTGIAVFNTFLYIASHSTSVINVVMLQTTIPVLIVAFTYLLYGERLTPRQAGGIALSLAGVLTLIAEGDPGRVFDLHFNRGDLWMLAACVSYALYSALLRRRPAVHDLSFITATFIIGAAMLFPFYLAETALGQPMPADLNALAAIAYVALGASLASYFAYVRVVALLGPNVGGLAVHVVPVFGTLASIAFFGELPRAYHFIGIALIGAGVFLATRRPPVRIAPAR